MTSKKLEGLISNVDELSRALLREKDPEVRLWIKKLISSYTETFIMIASDVKPLPKFRCVGCPYKEISYGSVSKVSNCREFSEEVLS